MKINNLYSPNFDKKKRPNNSIKTVIIHYTGMQSERASIDRLCSKKFKVSSHFIIKDKYIAWHAGKSNWGKYKNLNKNSIGIELVNKGHHFGYTNFKKKQLSSLIKICKFLIKKYKIKKNNIIGHSDIAPLRKIDPGEKFPWKQMATNKIGIWHSCSSDFLYKNRNIKVLEKKQKISFFKNLKKIGYYFSKTNKISLFKTLMAFQRHFRQELINGQLDKECLIIAQDIAKNCKNS
jgi:N-acetylmuramoyl-L-alanine amidase